MMKNTIITEFVNFKVLETTTNEQLLCKAGIFINDFLKKQNGFVDAELAKDVEGNARCFTIHYKSFEMMKAIVEKMRNCKEFDEFKSVIVPGSIGVTFQHQLSKW
jgi:hypothetical protein